MVELGFSTPPQQKTSSRVEKDSASQRERGGVSGEFKEKISQLEKRKELDSKQTKQALKKEAYAQLVKDLRDSGIDLESLWEQMSSIWLGEGSVEDLLVAKKDLKKSVEILNNLIKEGGKTLSEAEGKLKASQILNDHDMKMELKKEITSQNLIEKLKKVEAVSESFLNPSKALSKNDIINEGFKTSDNLRVSKESQIPLMGTTESQVEFENNIKKSIENKSLLAKPLAKNIALHYGSESQKGESFDKGAEENLNFAEAFKINKENNLIKTNDKNNFQNTLSQTDVTKNEAEIVKNTSFLVRKGGGEAQVKLTPEGLGEVNLKVTVENGRVNVEVLASSHEAKSILEKSSSDLKLALVGNQLQVENIKFEVAQGSQFDQKNGEFSSQESFLQDFRDSNDRQRDENLRDDLEGLVSGNPSSVLNRQAEPINEIRTASSFEPNRRLSLVV